MLFATETVNGCWRQKQAGVVGGAALSYLGGGGGSAGRLAGGRVARWRGLPVRKPGTAHNCEALLFAFTPAVDLP